MFLFLDIGRGLQNVATGDCARTVGFKLEGVKLNYG